MRSVDFDAVKAQCLCGARCGAISFYRAANFLERRWPTDPFERQTVPSDDAGRAEAVVAGRTILIEKPHAVDLRLADEADVPELREDPGSCVVHLLNNLPPSLESVVAVDTGGVFIVSRAGMRDERAFGYDEADAALGSPPIVTGDILIRHAPGRNGAGHWGHRDAVAQIETTDPSRLEQDFERARDTDVRHYLALALLLRPVRGRLGCLMRAVAEGRCARLLALTEINRLRFVGGISNGGKLRSLVGSVAERLIVRFATGAPIVGLAYLYGCGSRMLVCDLTVHDHSS